MAQNEAGPILPVSNDELPSIIKSQIHASLAMMREAIEECPDEVWLGGTHPNAFWQIAYHTLFTAHVYLHPTLKEFRPWAGHQADVQQPDALRTPVDADGSLPLLPALYTRTQVLELWSVCEQMVDEAIDSFDLESEECGFSWY